MFSPALSAPSLPPELPMARILTDWQAAPAEVQFLHPEILRAAMADYAQRHDDFFAEAYRLKLKAQALDRRIAGLAGLGRLVLPFLACHRPQGHQCIAFAGARRKGRLTDGTHDPDLFRLDDALVQAANLMLFKLVNVAHGHGAIYA